MIWWFLILGVSTLVVVCVAIALYMRLRRHLRKQRLDCLFSALVPVGFCSYSVLLEDFFSPIHSSLFCPDIFLSAARSRLPARHWLACWRRFCSSPVD